MKLFYKALSPIYYGLQELRNSMYEKEILESFSIDTKVISVGNISFGGTGKTPFVRWLCSRDSLADLKMAVVSRPYKTNFKEGVELLDEEKALQPELYGDEACMLALNLPKVDVWVSHSKSDAAKFISLRNNYDLIFIDDGFQHRRLHRDLDLVLLDSSVEVSEYRKFPEGNLRENLKNIVRADWFVYTKSTDVNSEIRNFFESKKFISPQAFSVMGFELGKPTRLTPAKKWEMGDFDPGDYILVTGVGNPKQVRQSFSERFGKAKDELFFSDHHKFSEFDISLIEDLQRKHSAKLILCTEKDYYKIRGQMKNASNLYFVPQDYICLEGEDRLVEKIRNLLS